MQTRSLLQRAKQISNVVLSLTYSDFFSPLISDYLIDHLCIFVVIVALFIYLVFAWMEYINSSRSKRFQYTVKQEHNYIDKIHSLIK